MVNSSSGTCSPCIWHAGSTACGPRVVCSTPRPSARCCARLIAPPVWRGAQWVLVAITYVTTHSILSQRTCPGMAGPSRLCTRRRGPGLAAAHHHAGELAETRYPYLLCLSPPAGGVRHLGRFAFSALAIVSDGLCCWCGEHLACGRDWHYPGHPPRHWHWGRPAVAQLASGAACNAVRLKLPEFSPSPVARVHLCCYP